MNIKTLSLNIRFSISFKNSDFLFIKLATKLIPTKKNAEKILILNKIPIEIIKIQNL